MVATRRVHANLEKGVRGVVGVWASVCGGDLVFVLGVR